DRRMQRDRDDEGAIEEEPECRAVEPGQDVGGPEPALDRINDGGEMEGDRAGEHGGRQALGEPEPGVEARRSAHSSPFRSARAVSRFRPAIERVGSSDFGQWARQFSWVWQAWQPASPATRARRSLWPRSRTSVIKVQARLSAA